MSPQQSIAHYRIISKLGEGGMGAVYRATDTKLNRDVAIKVLPASFAADPDRMARFSREAQVLASLNHPHIAAIYGVEELALVLELVEGPTLADRVAQGPLPVEEALPTIHQLIDALEYAHEKGIVHRDLKPANLKLSSEGHLKVLDFGLAKALAGDSAPSDPGNSPTLTMRATMAGVIMGTAAYMSPEQARGQSVDKRADIWSFGAVVYELLAGKQLFSGETVSDTLAAVLKNDPDLSAVPPRFHRLLTLCLTRDPRRRLRDISGARLLLEDAPTAVPVVAARRTPLPWIAAAIAVLAACLFAFLWIRNPPVNVQPIRFTMDTNNPIVFSPDGRWMLLIAGPGLQVRPVDGVSWRTLPGTEAAYDAFWSPDSSAIGYFAGGRLKTISIEGGATRTLAAAPDPQGGTWRGGVSDGLILFAAAHSLQTYDLHTGQLKTLPLEFKKNDNPGTPVFCPESDNFLYGVRDTGAGLAVRAGPLYRASLSVRPGPGEKIAETPYAVTFARHPHTGQWLLFFVAQDQTLGMSNRTLMAAPVDPHSGALKGQPFRVLDAMSNAPGTLRAVFDVAQGGMIYWRQTSPSLPIWRLTWFDRNGNVAATLGDPAGYSSIALSPDQAWIAAQQSYPTWRVSLYNAQTGSGRRLTTNPGAEGPPVWGPDSRSVYFSYQDESGWQVMRQSIESGSLPESLLPASVPTRLSSQDITPDGRHVLLVALDSGGIVRVDLSKPREKRRLEPLFTQGIRVRVSPGGNSLVLVSGAKLYSSPYPEGSGPLREIAAFPSAPWPFFSRDGKQLFAICDESLYVYPVSSLPGGGIRLGERSLLFKLSHPRRTDVNLGAVTRDGQRILAIATEKEEEAKLQVLSDWTTLLDHSR